MKLTRENIYIKLKGKSKEELTELYWLLKNNNNVLYRSFERFLEYSFEACTCIGFCKLNNFWQNGVDLRNRTEVTIQQLKEILQPMETKQEQLIKEAKERGFLTEGNEFYSCFNDENELRIIKPYDSESEINLYLDSDGYLRYFDGLDNKHNGMLCSNPAIYKDGDWAEIKNVYLTIEQQLEKAEAEVKRLKEAIEEEHKPKVGDWLRNYNTVYKYNGNENYDYVLSSVKITDKDLINKLNELIK